jgi:hypothetical protein
MTQQEKTANHLRLFGSYYQEARTADLREEVKRAIMTEFNWLTDVSAAAGYATDYYLDSLKGSGVSEFQTFEEFKALVKLAEEVAENEALDMTEE